jgi:MoaA/NifB/PqqE/SkfB family radical SAM enzyme
MRAKRLLNLFGDRLHTLPLVILYLTDGCNSRCVSCDIWRNPRRNMPMEMVHDIASTFRALDVRWVLLSGGEAMQHPHWPAIAQLLRKSGTYVMLLTNGLLLRKQCDELVSGVDEVIVSLDAGTRETYHKIRGVDAFDLVLEGIQEVASRGVSVVTRTTVQRLNYHEIPQIIQVAESSGASRISFLPVDTASEQAFGPRFDSVSQESVNVPATRRVPLALTEGDLVAFSAVLDDVSARFAARFESGLIAETPEKMKLMVGYFEGVLGLGELKRPRCNAPHTSVVIEVNGRLRPCYFLPSWGQLGQHALSEAINDPRALALRRAYRAGQRPECDRCVCPLYMGPRTLWRMKSGSGG